MSVYRTNGPLFNLIFFILAGNKDMHESLDEFEFRQICNRVMALEFLLNILKTNRPIKTKFCIHIIIDKIYVGNVNHCFSQICNRVTALD